MARVFALAALARSLPGAAAAFPPGAEDVLKAIVANKSSEYNCAISLAVFDGKTTIATAAGAKDGKETPVTVTDTFAWGSGTKPLTGASILRLVEEGKLKLEDKVAPIVDPFLAKMRARNPSQNFSSLSDLWGKASKGKIADVTVQQLATMSACIPDFDTAEPEGTLLKDSLRELLYSEPSTAPSPTDLMSVPWVEGQWWNESSYSSTNFMLLGLILAAKSGAESWEAYNQSSVLPEDLQGDIRFGVTGSPQDYTSVHGFDRTSYNMPVNKTNDQDVWGVDGVFSGWTAADMVASPSAVARLYWDIYAPGGRIASNSAKIMATPSGPHVFYGFATFQLTERIGQNNTYGEAWGHLGATYGYDSIAIYFPTLGLTIAVASNLENNDQPHPTDTACLAYNALAGLFLKQHVTCEYVDAGYHGGGCKCDQFQAPTTVVI